MNQTPLTRWHESHGARMVDFHDWWMPVQYSSVTEEHGAVRTAAGLFDLGHMGRIRISGPERFAFLEKMTTIGVAKAEEGRVLYGFFLNPRGGVIDDITAYTNPDHIFLVVNGANRLTVMDWLNAHVGATDARIEDVSEAVGMIAIQGPKARHIVQHETKCHLDSIGYYRFALCAVAGFEMIVSRTGYTGEDGFELYMDADVCRPAWEALLAAGEPEGLKPIGLGARDTLRLEASMPLYGNDLDETTTPIEAGLKRFVNLEEHEFIGREALVEQARKGVARRLACLLMDERVVPRSGYIIFAEGRPTGHVTSGTFSPTLGRGIAMGYVEPKSTQIGTVVEVEIRARRHGARVVERPFYKRGRD